MNKLTTFLFTLVLGLGFTINAEAQDCRRLLGKWEVNAEITEITHSGDYVYYDPYVGERASGTFEFTWANYGTATGQDGAGDRITAMWNQYCQQYEIAYEVDVSDEIFYVNVDDDSRMYGNFWGTNYIGLVDGRKIATYESITKPSKPEGVELESPKLRYSLECKDETYSTYTGLVEIKWTTVQWEETYILYYAPYPNVEWINSAKMGLRCHLSVWLPEGSAYYVAVMACDENYENCSDCSNVMVINLLSYNAPPTF